VVDSVLLTWSQEIVKDPERNNVSDCVYECKIRPDCKGFQAPLSSSLQDVAISLSAQICCRDVAVPLTQFCVFVFFGPGLEGFDQI